MDRWPYIYHNRKKQAGKGLLLYNKSWYGYFYTSQSGILLGQGQIIVGRRIDKLIFQQGVNMRPGAAGVAPADEVDYFHFALQSTCARRENTV